MRRSNEFFRVSKDPKVIELGHASLLVEAATVVKKFKSGKTIWNLKILYSSIN